MKGGTTALHDFICMHPDAARPTKKEIHFFSLYPWRPHAWYQSHFACEDDKVIGEASPTYFDVAYTQAIPKLISTFSPDIRLLLIVRNPIDRALSHFYHLQKINRVEQLQNADVNDFLTRPHLNMLTQTDVEDFYLHQIIDFSLYYRKLMTYLGVFDKESMLIIHNDQLKNAARETMASVYSFLGMAEYYDESFQNIKYSSGRTRLDLHAKTIDYLGKIFDDDYSRFCNIAGIDKST